MTDLQNAAPIGARLVQVAKAHRRWVGLELEKLGLHAGQELMLAHLCTREGERQTSLAAALGIELPTVHRMLGRLEAAGFVERRPDPSDARASLTYLTAAGRDTCARIREIWADADRRLREALPPADVIVFERLLEALASRLTQS